LSITFAKTFASYRKNAIELMWQSGQSKVVSRLVETELLALPKEDAGAVSENFGIVRNFPPYQIGLAMFGH